MPNHNGPYMLKLSGGPYGGETKYYRVPMYYEKAVSVARDFRHRIGCKVHIIPYREEEPPISHP